MSFPNPDNYARDCDCGTAGANTTPPPATIQTEIDSLDTRVTALEETNDVIVSSGGIANLTTAQQALIREGSIVVTTDGRRWVYSGAGSKVLQASYIELSRLNMPFAFRTAFATWSINSADDQEYFSVFDAVGPNTSLATRNFTLPNNSNIIACSATLYNTSGLSQVGGSMAFYIVTKASQTSTSPSQTYPLFNWAFPAIAAASMTSTYTTSLGIPVSASPIIIPNGTNLAMLAQAGNVNGASLRGEVTLYIVPTL
jgi:hypothetical protein